MFSQKMLIRDALNNQITGLMHGMIPTTAITMQYADDTLLFFKKDLGNIINLKWTSSFLNKCQR
jgi:hypothetical protein